MVPGLPYSIGLKFPYILERVYNHFEEQRYTIATDLLRSCYLLQVHLIKLCAPGKPTSYTSRGHESLSQICAPNNFIFVTLKNLYKPNCNSYAPAECEPHGAIWHGASCIYRKEKLEVRCDKNRNIII